MAKKPDYYESLARRESTDDPTQVNPGRYLGLYQLGEAALVDTEYYNEKPLKKGARRGSQYNNDWKGTWKGKNGINSKEDFLNNPEAQNIAVREYHKKIWEGYLKRYQHYEGQEIAGIKLDKSAMISCGHLVGHRAIKNFIDSNGEIDTADGNHVKCSQYLKEFAGFPVNYTIKPLTPPQVTASTQQVEFKGEAKAHEAPKKVELPKVLGTNAPKTGAPKKVEAAKTEVAKTEGPKKVEAAKTEVTKTEAPKKAEAAKIEAAKTEAPKKAEAAKTEATNKTEAPKKAEAAKNEASDDVQQNEQAIPPIFNPSKKTSEMMSSVDNHARRAKLEQKGVKLPMEDTRDSSAEELNLKNAEVAHERNEASESHDEYLKSVHQTETNTHDNINNKPAFTEIGDNKPSLTMPILGTHSSGEIGTHIGADTNSSGANMSLIGETDHNTHMVGVDFEGPSSHSSTMV